MSKRTTRKELTEAGVFTVCTTGAYGDISPAIAGCTWKQGIGLTAHEGGLGQVGVAAITSSMDAATVTLPLVADNKAAKTLKAFLQGEAPATFVSWDDGAQKAAYIWLNEKDPASGKKVKSIFVCGAMFDGAGRQIDKTSPAPQLSGQALWAREFEAAIQVDRTAGNATPVTSLTISKTTMLPWKASGNTKYALAVLRQAANGTLTLLDPALGDYTETATTITLATGLAANEAALVAYLYTDA